MSAVVVGVIGSAWAHQEVDRSDPFPVGERLYYSVRWLGMKCGSMTLESQAQAVGEDTHFVIVMTARSSRFFDGIYRVRSRIESRYSARHASSVSYHSVSEEKKSRKEERYEFDVEGGRLVRVKNGNREVLELGADHVHDPLSFVFKLRRLDGPVGEEVSLVLATSKGPLETLARIEERTLLNLEGGRRPVLRIVPEPKDGMLFSRSGRMELWVGTDEQRTLYRIDFDLSFGKLTAVLEGREQLQE